MTKRPAFEPIAIVGRACTLPGALDPGALWDAVVHGRDLLSRAPPARWAGGSDLDNTAFLCDPAHPEPDKTWSDRGGYVTGFERVFDPSGFLVPAAELRGLDPLFLWTLHTSRAALHDAGFEVRTTPVRTGAILGNLSFPSAGMARYAAAVWSKRADRPDPRNRFSSGLPALLLQRALGLSAGAFALDAACASSLYAIRYACDWLHEGRADLMIAGAVNCADDLFLHVGFSALAALSRSGRSRPFHAEADGLVPAEGAAFVVLERLSDAVRRGHEIHGVIRGVGLSNDGKGRGFLVPSAEGQERAIRAAYEESGVAPSSIGLLECHATGTQVGDAVELASLQAVFGGAARGDLHGGAIPIGSLKSNLGHPITVAGAAALIKVLEAMRAGIRPPTLHVERPLPAVAATGFRLLEAAEPWRAQDLPRRAGISAFGFGGNDAHLVVEEYREGGSTTREGNVRSAALAPERRPDPWREPAHSARDAIAIVGIGVVAAGCPDRRSFAAGLYEGKSYLRPLEGSSVAAGATLEAPIDSFEVDLATAGVPPADLRRTLAQQLLVLDAGAQAAAEAGALPRERTGVFIGMGVDAEVARYGARWRLEAATHDSGSSATFATAREQVVPALESAGVVGTMPNMVANRLNRRLDLGGASCAVSAEEASGLYALELACRALRRGELDAALVGAVDLSCEPVQREAAAACLPESSRTTGDAAVALVLRRRDDAERQGLRIYGLVERVDGGDHEETWGPDADQISLTPRLGHAHAASGLLHLTAAALCIADRIRPGGAPWLPERPRAAVVQVRPMTLEEPVCWRITEHRAEAPLQRVVVTRDAFSPATPFHFFEGANASEVLAALEAGRRATELDATPRARLVIVAGDADTLARRVERARRHLRRGAPAGEGVHFRAEPVVGETALVFASAGTAYLGMGSELLRALPELGDRVDARFGDLATSLRWAVRPRAGAASPGSASREARHQLNNTERLWGSSAICRLHAELSLGLLGLRPDAAIGYSSGESAALFSLGAWTDIDEMRREIVATGLFDRALGERYEAVAQAWGVPPGDAASGDLSLGVAWQVWNVLADVEHVRELLRDEPRAHLAIVHTLRNCVVAGEETAVLRVVERIGRRRCHRLDYDIAAHVPEVDAFREPWLRIHRRRVSAVPRVRFYSAGRDGAYEADTEACAQAILAQAVGTLDFPRVIQRAYRDGVRVFVEHGPQASCSAWIREILGERKSSECVIAALDRGARDDGSRLVAPAEESEDREPGAPDASGVRRPASSLPGLEPILETVAALLAAGVAVDRRPLENALAAHLDSVSRAADPQAGVTGSRGLRLPGHPPAVRWPTSEPEWMAPAPSLPSVHPDASSLTTAGVERVVASSGDLAASPQIQAAAPRAASPLHAPTTPPSSSGGAEAATILRFPRAADLPASAPPAPSEPWQDQLGTLHRVHQQYLEHQARVHAVFLAGRYPNPAEASETLASPAVAQNTENWPEPVPRVELDAVTVPAPPSPAAPTPADPSPEPGEAAREPVLGLRPREQDVAQTGSGRDAARGSVVAVTRQASRPGFALDRAQLEVHASGSIASIFGPVFEAQEGYARQVRMPEPPLLLADRMTGIEAEPGVPGTGTIWTETDVRADSWYLHRGRMPAGVLIEAGQADLMLISYMGADLRNRGERVYRLLGCELTYQDDLPRPGETLAYEIRVDGHAEQDGIRLFFFHYDCHVAGRPRIQVRHGQAGFFTAEELRASAGVLWSPEEAKPKPDPRLDAPRARCRRRAFDRDQVRAFAAGRLWDCFGEEYELAKTHTDTPTIQTGDMLFLDRVPVLDLPSEDGEGGGPWGRGYLEAEATVTPDAWYFAGHFKNDPCMPGTLMFEGCLQALSFVMAAMGFTLERDGWRFQPVTGEPIPMRCRGQVTPSSRLLTYQVFVEEVIAGPLPTLYADLLCTVDGLKAFHARRVGLQLVPSWPLENQPELLERQLVRARRHPGFERAPEIASLPLDAEASGGRLELGYPALLACAWGRPSHSFGPMYRRFDGPQRVPRLPGPPYHFLSRVTAVTGDIGAMTVGSTVMVEYDVPGSGPESGPDAWYFEDNGARTMPWAVLLEAALQPCGWLASYIGSATTVEGELAFRNLDGTATVHHEVLESVALSGSGPSEVNTLSTAVVLEGVSRSAGMIIVSFDVVCRIGERRVLDLKTVFGFFPSAALAKQVGLPTTAEQKVLLATPSDYRVELASEPARYFGGTLRLAGAKLRMLDRVTGYWPQGGAAGLGRLRAERDVDAGDWYFRAHFFQDPVQPGSLGIEAMVQLLQFFVLESDLAAGIPRPRFEPLALGVPITWKYRGQVVPANERITITLDVTSVVREERSVLATGSASLWCDGKRIYSADDLGVRVVSGSPGGSATLPAADPAPAKSRTGTPPGTARERSPAARSDSSAGEPTRVLDPEVDTWLLDHRPTWCRPSLPMMCVVDLLASAVPAELSVVGVRDVKIDGWIDFPGPRSFRAQVEPVRDGEWKIRLFSRILDGSEPERRVASARVLTGTYGAPPKPLDPLEGAPLDDPYESGHLFHGPAFQLLLRGISGAGGSTTWLDARPSRDDSPRERSAGTVPVGRLHPALLDAALHGIPHDRLHLWSPEIAPDRVAYPIRVPAISFHGPVPEMGELRCEARLDGFLRAPDLPRFRVQLIEHDRVWAELVLVEVCFPKGPLGSAPPDARRAFLRDRRFVEGLSLSRQDSGVTRLSLAAAAESDWMPGTLRSLYGTQDPEAIAVQEHLAARHRLHPGLLPRALPLNPPRVEVTREANEVVVHGREAGTAPPGGAVGDSLESSLDSPLELEPIAEYWRRRLGTRERWLGQDLIEGLVQRYVRRVVLEDPESFATLRTRGAIYCGNHQVQIESILITHLLAGLAGRDVVTMANAKHKTRWIGWLIERLASYPGIAAASAPFDPIRYFDQSDPGSLFSILSELAPSLARGERSFFFHAAGTRSRSEPEPTTRISSVFLDFVVEHDLPFVPIRFTGGLTAEPVAEKLELPRDHARQDYWIGRAIEAAELRALPYADRRRRVLEALDAVAPEGHGSRDTHPEFAARVAEWSARTGVGEVEATFYRTLEERTEKSAETLRVLNAIAAGAPARASIDGDRDSWHAAVARRLSERDA